MQRQSYRGTPRVLLLGASVTIFVLTIDSVALAQVGFTAASPLDGPRERHAAVLLNDGQILITGGNQQQKIFLNSSLLYPAAGGAPVATGSLPAADIDLSLTVLQSGKVLAVGGYATSGSIVDLYNPLTGTWSSDTPMLADATVSEQGRSGHGVTLLLDGRVFVVGGSNVIGEDFHSAELYTPGATFGSWAMAPTPPNPRGGNATATLLADGSVLVVGGRAAGGPVAAVDRYVPNATAGIWVAAQPLSVARLGQTATVLPNGKVLVAGGVGPGGSLQSTAELYDPSTGSWSLTGAMATARYDHSATLLPSGFVLVTGGNDTVVGSAELYDHVTGTWFPAGNQLSPRLFHTATLTANGKVLLTGGDAGPVFNQGDLVHPVASAESYTPGSSLPAPMVYYRFDALNLGLDSGTLHRDGQVLAARTGGVLGGAIATGSNDAVREFSASAPELNLLGGTSIIAWVKPAGPHVSSPSCHAGTVVSKGGNLSLLVAQENDELWYENEASGDGIVVAEGNAPVGRWTQIAVTRDASGVVQFYRNGVPIGTPGPSAKAPTLNDASFTIGYQFDDAPDQCEFNGAIDEVEIFNRKLSGAEVCAEFSAVGTGTGGTGGLGTEAGAPEAGAPEAGAPEAGASEAGVRVSC